MSTQVLNRLAQQLVHAVVPGLGDDRASSLSLTNRVSREIRADVSGGARKEWDDVKQAIQGLSRTAKIRVQEDLAEALDKNLRGLELCRQKGKRSWEGEEGVKMSNLPQYVHLLLNLADRPSIETHDFAYTYLHRVPPSGPTADQILYQEIMASEPFEPGEFWDEEVLSGWTDSEDEYERETSSEDSDGSPEEDYVKTPSSAAIRAERRREEEVRRKQLEEDRTEEALEVVRGLKDGYWNKPGKINLMKEGVYGWRDLVTQSNTASLAAQIVNNPLVTDNAITSFQLQREIIFALSGRSGVIFGFSDEGVCSIIQDHPQVNHLSPASLDDVLQDFQRYANRAAMIRRFVFETLQSESPPSLHAHSGYSRRMNRPNKTQQAFAGACQDILSEFNLWLSELETAFIRGNDGTSSSSLVPGTSTASTPSLLLLELDQRSSTILVLLSSFIPHSSDSTVLLNMIHTSINTFDRSVDNSHFATIFDIFMQTAQPTWQMLGIWIRYGMPIPSSFTDPEEVYLLTNDEGDERKLEEEFFIQRDRDVSWADEDFYECGFVVGDYGYPEWIGDELGEMILEAGKARGLLKSLLGGMGMVEGWQDLQEVLVILGSGPEGSKRSGIEVNIAEKISNYLTPICQLIQFHLRRVLDEECGLGEHLDAIEGVMYFRGFEVLDDWSLGLFQKVSSNEKWADFQTLTSTFRDITEEKQAGWMNPAGIRIRTTRSSGAIMGPRALEIVRVQYEVPFPLSQLFSSTSVELRAEVFTFILQLRMAHYLLVQTKKLDRDLSARMILDGENGIRGMWRMRQKLSWFIDTVYTWLTDRIIEVQSAEFRRTLSEMTSLKLMIALELEHTRKIRNYAFLHPSTSEIYENIQNIFDLIHTFSECYTSYINENPFKAKRKEDYITRRRPRLRRNKKKDDLSSDEEDEREIKEHSISFIELGLGERMNKMDKDLDESVVQIREGVERLAMESELEVDGWSMLAFSLEEWR
ncbi:hypothetical protein I302_101721 [Kwoniella bestiolae CBS 10118]|uniref:Spindle pole body component n=1 Tax=Kwoniella bestiolae CBS 10118 TaxID=1296100 RepID=A0A1B9GD31_9TREE|nr:hypothetical protein I302_00397 [Kwoniella bestiolae CBS 10118]OCF28907.1 hypothetical protein I302_00397 [Kwoniella bestiolae CBS 10118]